MTVALVKEGTIATAATSSITPAFGQATIAGNLLVGAIVTNVTNLTAITQSGTPTGWADNGSGNGGVHGATNATIAIWLKQNCGASETAPTFTQSGASSMIALLAEFSGVLTSSAVQLHNTNAGTSSSINSGTFGSNTAVDGDLILWATQWLISGSQTVTFSQSMNGVDTDNGLLSGPNDVIDNGATKGTLFLTFSWGAFNNPCSISNAGWVGASTSITTTKTINAADSLCVFAKPAAGATALASALSPAMTLTATNAEAVALAGDMT